MGSASASSAASDGATGANTSSRSVSNVPYAVRTGSAKALHPMRSSDPLRITIGLKLHDQAGLDKLKASLQDPKSAGYHRYLSAAQFNARFGPTASDEASVIKYATAHGLTVTKRYSNRLLVDLQGSVSQVQSTFGVHLNEYTIGKRQYFANAEEPQLGSIKSLVTSVSGLDNIGQMQSASGATDTSKMARYSAGPSIKLHSTGQANGSMAKLRAAIKAKAAHPNITGGYYDPTDLYSSQAYDVDALQNVAPCCNPAHLSTGSPANSSIAIVTAGAHTLSTDLAGFQSRYGYLAYLYNEYYIDGTPTGNDFEGTMDVEWALSMANSYGSYLDTAHIYLYSGANAQFTTFHDMYNTVLTNNTAKIVSSSWGCTEFYCISDAQMNTDHTIYDSMVAQGFTMVNSSGDAGAFSDCSHRSVSNPAADPDWLAIGATELHLASGPVYQSESVWGDTGTCSTNNGGSGGGCSAKYAAPTWQSSISSFCGSSSRALPDIALNGSANTRQNTYFNGAWYGGAGTSIAAPMTGGLLARAASYRIQLGNACSGSVACGPLGNVSSKIYSIAQSGFSGGRKALYDIADGSCTTNEIGSGYCAIAGYDRATGWGSVNALNLAWGLNWYSVPEASAPSVTMTGPATSGWVNSGSIAWTVTDNGSPPTGVAGYTAKWDADPGNPLSATTPGAGNSYYSGPAVHGTTGSTGLLTGCHTLYVRAWDNMGLSTLSSYGPVCYDTTAPVMTVAPSMDFLSAKQALLNGSAAVRVKWNATDALSGIGSYLPYQSVDGGSYTVIPMGNPASNHVDLKLAPGHTYTFAVGAYDKAGNFSGYAYSNNTSITLYDDSSSAIAYTNAWTTQNISSAIGGHSKYATAANKSATLTYSGRSVAWVSSTGTGSGKASVTLDGGTATTVDLNSASGLVRDQVFHKTAGNGAHTLVVKNLATAGNPRIDIDAFLVIKNV